MKQPNMPDMSPAMIAMAQISGDNNRIQAQNSYDLGIRRISQETLQSNQMYLLARHQLAAEERTAGAELDAKLEIARMNFDSRVQDREMTHQERMHELDVRRHEADVQGRSDELAAQESARADRESRYF